MGCDIILPAVRNLGKNKGEVGAFYLGLVRELKRADFGSKSCENVQKHEKSDFDQGLACTAPKV